MADLSGPAFVDAAYWILFRRAPTLDEAAHGLATILEHGRHALAAALTRHPECADRLDAGDAGREPAPASVVTALDGFGSDATFVGVCYTVLFGRDADAGGLEHYRGCLRDGLTRDGLVRAFIASDEFAARRRRLVPAVDRIPRDVQLCELANPAKWDNTEWRGILRSLVTVSVDHTSMHRKLYEFTQTIFGLQRLGRLTTDAKVLSVGAGHEPLLYWLANRVGHVVATDLYGGAWTSEFSREGNPSVLRNPAAFAPFPYREDRLTVLQMDGVALGFRDAAFDIVYSLSSIEHFGGVDGARRSVADMARVLKPGGILALATEWCVRGPAQGEVFSPDEVRHIIDHPSLRLVQPIDEHVWNRYEMDPVDLRVDRFQTPHMLLKHDDTIFTSVYVFLEKPGSSG